jgi:hypothetical protein
MTADPMVGLISGTRAGFTDTFAPTSGFSGSGGFFVTSSADGTILVEYDYTPAPTPEPATLLLMASGLGSLVARRRWRGNKDSSSSR